MAELSSPDFLFDPDEAGSGFEGMRELIRKGAPDPERGGREFRFNEAEPLATHLREVLPHGEIVTEALVGETIDFLPAVFLARGSERARATCRIVVRSGIDYRGDYHRDGWFGTGFLVGRDVLLTNHHVINSEEVARQTVTQFNYQQSADGSMEEPQEFRLRPDRLFVTSAALDYTFVGIDPAASARFGFVPLSRRFYAVEIRDRANIVQHPAGRPKEVVLHKNHVVTDNGIVLHYESDTEGGSSGSSVCDNRWEVIALHHATLPTANGQLNEGIKLSAIAADLEQKAAVEGADGSHAESVLRVVRGIDSGLGYFGCLGRPPSGGGNDLERVVDAYRGGDHDIDVGAWNIEWFSNRYPQKLEGVARLVADMNLDIWALVESSPAAAEALVGTLRDRYGLEFDVAHSEPEASTGKQSTSVIWNPATVQGQRLEWPEEIDGWFRTHSRDFDDLGLEAVHGKIFNRYPGLFHFATRDGRLDFNLVPVHLKAKSEGSLRRAQASKVLAAAVRRMKVLRPDADRDFVILGDFNATLASGDFDALDAAGWSAMTSDDEDAGAITYVKGRYRSLIDHIYLSPNLGRHYGTDDLFIVAADRTFPDYVRDISDHLPVVARLSLGDGEDDGQGRGPLTPSGLAPATAGGLPPELSRALEALVEAYSRYRG